MQSVPMAEVRPKATACSYCSIKEIRKGYDRISLSQSCINCLTNASVRGMFRPQLNVVPTFHLVSYQAS